MATYSAVSYPENSVEFKVYVVHREGWAVAKSVTAARMDYFAAIKRIQEDLGLAYVRAAQPVVLVQGQGRGQGEDGGPVGLRVWSTDAQETGLRGRSGATADQLSPAESPVDPELGKLHDH